MQKIIPFLWFESQAEEAMNLYVSAFKNAKPGKISYYGEGMHMPKGTVLSAEFELEGVQFTAFNGGPHDTFTPAISFFVSCESVADVEDLFRKLSDGGQILMPLDTYPFSKRYGWVQDKFGLTWQMTVGERGQSIAPFLMFTGAQHGRAEEAMRLYTSLFPDSAIGEVQRWGANEGTETEGTVKHGIFQLAGQEFMAFESSYNHGFTFNDAVSLHVCCTSQEEVDHYWDGLLDGGQAQQCGWLKDKFGLSWQIIPVQLMEWMSDPDPATAKRVMDAMLKMVKIDIEALRKAHAG